MHLSSHILQEEEHSFEQNRGRKRKRDEEVGLFSALLSEAQGQYNFRRFWVDTRSIHYATHVLDGVLLREEWFVKVFRMNRKSFETLNRILGMHSHLNSSLILESRT